MIASGRKSRKHRNKRRTHKPRRKIFAKSLRRSQQMKYSLNKKQKGGTRYTLTSSDPNRSNHLLDFLKLYDINSQITSKFENCGVDYKGIAEKDLSIIKDYLQVTYAASAEIVVDGPTGRGEYTIKIRSNIEDNPACRFDRKLFQMTDNSPHFSVTGDQTYSSFVETDATDAFRYYLTRNNKLVDLTNNNLERLDEKPVAQ
jgi:hypothetical protein